MKDEKHPECIEVTEEHLDKFGEEDPVPIYEVPTDQLGYGNRVLTKFRELVFDSKGGAEYISFPFPKIRVSREFDEKIKDDVVQHEVNHYLDRKSEPDKYDKRFAAVVFSSLGLVFTVGIFPQPVKGVLSLIGSLGLIVYPLYHLFVVEEKKADEGTVFEDRGRSLKGMALYPVALLATPFKSLSFVEEFWMERKRIFKKLGSVLIGRRGEGSE